MLSRNLYILAATLVFFSVLCYVLGFTGITHEPGAPPDGSLWRTIGIVLMLLGLFTALLGVLQGMFEQAERRTPGGQANIRREHLRQRESGKNQRKRRS
jgi:hypothetical protein